MKFVVTGHLSLEIIDKQLTFWQTMKEVWVRCDPLATDDLETLVCKLYIRMSNVTNVQKAIREMGLAPRGFDSNDVSAIIRKCSIADVELARCARALLDSNWKQVQIFN